MRQLRPFEVLRVLTRIFTQGRFLRQTPFWPREQMRDWQFQRISKLVQHACNYIPFYSELYRSIGFAPGDLKSWDDFARLPVVTKDQVIANYPQRMLKVGTKLDELIVSRSSGSSGKVLDVAYDADAMILYILAGLRLYKMCFQYKPWHRQLYIYTSPYPMNSLLGFYPCKFVSTLAPISEILSTLREFKPHLLVGYPSHLKQLLQVACAGDLAKIRPRAISVNSEMSTQAERDDIASLLDCTVLDEYSSEELTRIAAQCHHKTYHIFEDINYVETMDDQGNSTTGPGTIVGTNLHNFAMPMIRYQQNDLARVEEASCPCGWRFRRMLDFEGRRNDSFELPSGRILTSGFLLDATYEFLLAYGTAVRDFCLIQRSRTCIVLQIVPGVGWDETVNQKIGARFCEFLQGDIPFEVQVVAECEKTKSGKRNAIINMMNRGL